MADNQHFELLMRDVDAWNRWRADNPKVKPDLAYAVLRGANLPLANLTGAQLREADLVLANLRGADLRHTDLSGANLVGARLMGVDLAHARYLRCGPFDGGGFDRRATSRDEGRQLHQAARGNAYAAALGGEEPEGQGDE